MKYAVRLTALALAGAVLTPAQAAEGYILWDDFSSTAGVDMTKWLATDRYRAKQGDALRFLQRDRGGQTDNTGSFNNSWGANLKNPALITQMRATMMVYAFNVTGCTANTTPSTVQARMLGSFFNAGPGAPTSRIGDVLGMVRFKRDSNSADPAGVLRVEGLVAQCTTSDCNYDSILIGSVDLGTALPNDALSLRFDWDPTNDRFNFYRDSNPVARVSYNGVSDSLPPFLPFKQIGTRTIMASCQSGPRTGGFMDAKFDNLSVNLSAAP